MGEVKEGLFHGKGLFYRKSENEWELGEYEEGKLTKALKSGEGRPQSLNI